MPTCTDLRQRHPKLSYTSFTAVSTESTLSAEWRFELAVKDGQPIVFQPTLELKGRFETVSTDALNTLVFNLGLVELLSYWKAACPPVIEIQAGFLSDEQVKWWHDLLIQGLGEFFYTNQIDFTASDLVEWQVAPNAPVFEPSNQQLNPNRIIVPIGGGKDSAVTLELLKDAIANNQLPAELQLWAANPTEASRKTADVAGLPLNALQRTIDPQLLELNNQGYLNGHTPFSAYLAFAFGLVAAATGAGQVLVSNEVSANECNAVYKGHEINHQYSKSFAFEQKFCHYVEKYLLPEYQYRSFLRPLHEIQIAKLFSQFPQHFSTFKSCNRGQKLGGIWCHECPKCLFAFVMLFPFIEVDILTSQIFNHNLFEDESMVELALKLILSDKEKPFECVGSYDESKAALWLAVEHYRSHDQPLPVVLQTTFDQVLQYEPDLSQKAKQLLEDWNPNHALTPNLAKILETSLRTI